MTLADRATAARLVLIERRDTVAVRDPGAARVRRYRLARTQLAGRAGARAVGVAHPVATGLTATGGGLGARKRPCRSVGGRKVGGMEGMEEKSSGPSFGMRIVAALVLALAAWFLLKVDHRDHRRCGVVRRGRGRDRRRRLGRTHAVLSARQVPPCPS